MSTLSKASEKRPRVAVIGGGIFGVTAAIELARNFNVTLFERREGLFGEATYANQYRHHYGYHYPRSPETVKQCAQAKEDFELVWGKAVVPGFPAYYCIAKNGSRTSADEYISFCVKFKLPHDISYPPPEFLNKDAVDLCIVTPEPIYNFGALKQIASHELKKAGVDVRSNHTVTGCSIAADGRKTLAVTNNGVAAGVSFDYVVNATYANFNLFQKWLGLPTQPMEFRLKEIIVVEIKGSYPAAVTIMDGPFVTMVPTGKDGRFTVGDVPRSIHDTRFSSEGSPWTQEEIKKFPSRWQEILSVNSQFIPILKDAEYLYSMWSVLPIKPRSELTDTRITEVVDHSSGCWSVFEGKIITSVSAARKIAENLLR